MKICPQISNTVTKAEPEVRLLNASLDVKLPIMSVLAPKSMELDRDWRP